jgi:CRP/FNR family transcriptional regulator, cyclic AMP receptor protein
MACSPEMLKRVPLFALLDDEETAVLAAQVEVKTFTQRQRIWKIGDPGGRAYVLVSGVVRVTTVDEDHQEVVVDQPAEGEFFGFASMLKPRLSPLKKVFAWKSTATTFPLSWNANPTPGWTC